jgi:hypothetical protein
MNKLNPIILSLIISLSYISFGIAGNIDLSIELNIEPVTEVEFLQNGTFTITVSNLGPDTAGGDSSSNFPISAYSNAITAHENGLQDLFIRQNTDINQACFFIFSFGEPLPGGLPSIAYFFEYPEIPANDSITCYAKYLIGFEGGSRDFSFNVRSFSDNETNLSNNTANITFRIKPKLIPSLNIWSLIILMVIMLIIACYVFNKKALEVNKRNRVL